MSSTQSSPTQPVQFHAWRLFVIFGLFVVVLELLVRRYAFAYRRPLLDTAIVLAIAQRVKTLCTEAPELRRLAKLLELDVLDRDEYLERFAKGSPPASPGSPE